tara:strand:- start:88 stop:324 length:237 start_codon:yes stop_codon:yes gene_type:complete
MKKRVEGHPHLVKDPDTGVIDVRNGVERDKHKLAVNQAKLLQDSHAEISELKEEIKELSGLKEEMDEIKDLLKQLLIK